MQFLPQATLNLVNTESEAAQAVRELATALLPGPNAGTVSIPIFIAPLEETLHNHQAALLHALTTPGATVATVRAALRADVLRAGGPAGIGAAVNLPANLAGVPSDSSGQHAPPESSTAIALRSAAHKELEARVMGSDLESQAGLFDLFSLACDGQKGRLLAMRVLFNQTEAGDPLAKRDAALGALNDKRSRLDEFVDYMLTLDLATGAPDPRLRKYTVARTSFLSLIKRQQFKQVPWVPSPGLLGFLQHRDSKAQAVTLPEADYYCIPQVLEDLGPYGQKFFTGLYGFGAVVDVRDGYSWDGMCKYFAEHLNLARRLDTKEDQIKWITYAVDKFNACLDLISDTVREIIFSSDVANVCTSTYMRSPYDGLGGPNISVRRPLLRADAPPLSDLADRKQALQTMLNKRCEEDVFGGVSTSTAATYDDVQLPRLSAAKKRAVPEPPQSGKGRGRGRGGRGDEPPAKPAAGRGLDAISSTPVPGSRLKTFKWKKSPSGKQYLIVSGRVWNVTELAAHLRVSVSAICWPYVLARASSPEARSQRCDKWGKPGHGAQGQGAHIHLDIYSDEFKPFWREASVQEKAGIESMLPAHASAAAKGKGKSAARGKGKGRGGRGRGGYQHGADDADDGYDWSYEDYYAGDGWLEADQMQVVFSDLEDDDMEEAGKGPPAWV